VDPFDTTESREVIVLRKLVVLVVVVLSATLTTSMATVAATDNSFCDLSDPTVVACADVVVQKTAENPCTGELVVLSGTIHVAVFEDANQFRIHTNWQDVSGVALGTGTIYEANEATRLYEVARPPGSFSFVLQDERTIVSKGGLENFILREYFAITTDPFTINERSEMKCSG
jgi:hypothetical protein